MDRVDQLRAARNSPHVSFTEYMKLRAKTSGVIFIFEGKQCPGAYVGWVQQLLRASIEAAGQIIARGKKNVLALRDLVLKNPQTTNDKNLYFVDRDYDVEPKPGTYPDVYVTRGYSIENELAVWSVLDAFMRSYFDIADGDDHEALLDAKSRFELVFRIYIEEAREVHRVIYTCRTGGVDCYPGESVFQYIDVDWCQGTVRRSYQSLDELLETLKVEVSERTNVAAGVDSANGFDALDPLMDWRGKFHFSFVRGFLIELRNARVTGSLPFKRAAKVNADPAHPSLLGLLGGLSVRPACLTAFIEQFVATAVPASA